MRTINFLSIAIVYLGLSACATNEQAVTPKDSISNLDMNWGYVLVEPDAFSLENVSKRTSINGIIGQERFVDEASCLVEAKKRLLEEATKRLIEHPNGMSLQAYCFVSYPNHSFQPYKVAQKK